MKLYWLKFGLLCLVVGSGCSSVPTQATPQQPAPQRQKPAVIQNTSRVIHTLVALCDNEHQGIVPVPPRLGNGEDLPNNLYWGAAYGVKTFFAKSTEWTLVTTLAAPQPNILERCLFRHRTADAWLIADAYRGSAMKETIGNLFAYAAGADGENIEFDFNQQRVKLGSGSGADLLVFVGHNGLMDFRLPALPTRQDNRQREAIVLCCLSEKYFAEPLRSAGTHPLLLTTGLMAPEAYILKTALDGWLKNESRMQIRQRAATAYNQYQRCGLNAARKLFSTGS
jgi:hypothetical protein